ncbi:ATP-dependent helicase [Clostridium magnum]|uniref:DNA 3'-5' helicase n=1 Tax=Clostridium magnum DSM 2767 TaxID=1121326 RepID=A0A162RUI2_9CLOT|nr:ATP-dependent helicase [Clostridium magnum]KZL90394.1 DNA helicase II [Clostridium magnum DSM 2767]SHH84060.1 DNA helicase-2 / ATP-dependent DNA helicase PcrA [Clostridium magnum DSM 2767]
MNYEKELERLNEYQKEAVLDESDACIVNANVGSGKTTVLISKIIYLHYAKNISYKDMIVLTFTNKAANEIKERLMDSDHNIQMEELQGFGTFHSVALHLLKDILPVEKMGYAKDFLVIDPEEELDIAMRIIQEQKLLIKYKNRLKKRLEQAMSIQIEEQRISPYNDDIFKLVQLLKEEKIRQNKMSFSDLLQNANVLLEDYRIEPKWIIIDEVQDSDKLQLHFIDKLKGVHTRLFAVGDPNQVIYSWRGSTLNMVYTLKHKYGARELSLPINYRSSSSILEAAKCFLQDGGSLTGIREPGSKIVVKNQYNPFNEAYYLADKILELHKLGVPYNEIAVFYRLQNQSQAFEDVFLKNELPYEVSLKKTIRDIPVLNWVIKLFRFSVNTNDSSSGIYVLSNKDYGERITEKEAGKIVKGQGLDKSELFIKMQGFASKCSEITKSEELYNYFQFDKYIRPTASTYMEDKESICALLDIIIKYVQEKQMPFLKGLPNFINSSALYGVNILQKDIKSDTDSVKLMTLHASKGLEFSHVFITGVNYGLIPLHTRDMEEEEERRLFFVGITRAKDYLELSYYTNPDYPRVMAGESRYINMIPTHLIQNDGVKSGAVNLQELKKQIQEAKAEKDKEEVSVEPVNQVPIKQVKHKKYGIGKVLKEDDMMIEVEFENYGVKGFIKAFSELEFL